MHDILSTRTDALRLLCDRFHVVRLEVFGSAARGHDFHPGTSDIDFLVSFAAGARNNLALFADFKDALEALLGHPVDLVEREALETSRNPIRRRRIFAEARTIHG